MANILGPDGQPIDKAVLRESQTAKLDWIKREFPLHPSRGLTPGKLYQALDMAERGYIRDQHELFIDMEEKDTQIFADLQKRKRAILTLDWSVQAPPNASAAEKAEAELATELLKAVPSLEDLMVDCLDAIGHGFACMEIEWHRPDGRTLPKCIEHRPQPWFTVDHETRTKIQLRKSGSFEGEPLLPFGWIVHIHKAKSGYVTRAGLLRVLTLPYLFRNYSARDFAEFLEIFGLPIRIGKYAPGTSEPEKLALLNAVVGIGHDAAGIIPDDMMIELVEATKGGSGDPFMQMIDWCERSISKAILGGTLTSGADGKSSTNALGNVHNEVRHDLLVSDARQLESTLNEQLIYPLLALNGTMPPNPLRMPQLKFDTRQPEDLKLFADALPKLAGSGLQIPVAWAHNKLMIPEPKNGEPVMTAPVQVNSAGPDPAAKKPGAAEQLRAKLKSALAALKGGTKELDGRLFPDQAALDRAMEDLDGGALDDAMRTLLQPLLDKLSRAETPDDMLEMIAQLYPDMPADKLREQLAQVIFVSELWGMVNGTED
jgi:phage gp29-like protein